MTCTDDGCNASWGPPFHRNFGGLVLCCIDSYDSESRRIFQHFSRSTRFTILCTAQISKFQQKIVQIFGVMKTFFRFFPMNLAIFPPKFHQNLSEFRENVQKMAKYIEMLIKSARKIGKCQKFRNSLFW